MNSSGKTTMSASWAAAVARAARTFSALPAISPTVELSCATAIESFSAGRALIGMLYRFGIRPRNGVPRMADQHSSVIRMAQNDYCFEPTARRQRLTSSLEPPCRRYRLKLRGPLFLQQFSKQKCEINRLFGVESGIANRVVPVVEICFGDRARSAGTFGYILASHFEVNSTGVSAFGLMHFKEATHFFEDEVERTRFVPRGRRDRVSVHRIA